MYRVAPQKPTKEAPAEMRRYRAAGYRQFQIKVGGDWHRDIDRIKAVVAHFAASTPPQYLQSTTDLMNYNTRSTGVGGAWAKGGRLYAPRHPAVSRPVPSTTCGPVNPQPVPPATRDPATSRLVPATTRGRVDPHPVPPTASPPRKSNPGCYAATLFRASATRPQRPRHWHCPSFGGKT